jgi:hypothetical protein
MNENLEVFSIIRRKIRSFGNNTVEIYNFLFRADFWNTLYNSPFGYTHLSFGQRHYSLHLSCYMLQSIAILTLTRIVIYYIAVPLALSLFGALTIYNIWSKRNRVVPVGQKKSHRCTEDQLAHMLIIQVGVFIVFSTHCGIAYVLVNIVPSSNTPFFASIRTLTIIWQQCSFFSINSSLCSFGNCL